MIIRFSAAITGPSHKSIFQANLVKLFLWKFLTFLDNISICQAVSSLPTKYLVEIFYFWSWLWLWSTALSDAWNQKPPTFLWMTRPGSQWPKPKTEFLGTSLPLFYNQSNTRGLMVALAWLEGQESPGGNGLLTETLSLLPPLSPLEAPF